jgi:hypothetical protein
MSFDSPGTRIYRRSVEGMEGMHSKMFDPPTLSPATPDLLLPTSPVAEVMAAAGFSSTNPPAPARTIHRQLMHGMQLPTWDGQQMQFFLFRDPVGIGAAKDGSFPAPTNRVPRGVIFHCETQGSGPPPHTIHWHGQEPTPMNDGVGHCSMELGHYVYQWQPNFIGSYFYHCHRNTVQHFEFGLYGFTIIDPPDAFWASIASFNADGSILLNVTPIGNGRPEPGFPLGRRRTAANLNPAINPAFAKFGQTNFNPLTTPDPEANNPNLPSWLKFATDPHAHTVHYDVEALWVLDDRDINWSNLAPDARATYPRAGSQPGINDNFHGNAGGTVGPNDFFAFNDYRSTHWYVTGVPVPDDTGLLRYPGATDPGTLDAPGAGEIGHGIVVPPELMSGVSGVQVSINAGLNQNIFLRVLDAAYNNARITFPVDIVIIEWDGRALGVPPFGSYNEPVLVPAGTPMEWSVARRFGCMMRSSVPVNSHATVEFIDTLRRDVRFTARIPINIGAGQDVQTFSVAGTVTDTLGAPVAGVALTTGSSSLGGSPQQTAVTDGFGNYILSGLAAGIYTITPTLAGVAFNPPSTIVTLSTNGAVGVDFQTAGTAPTYSVSGGATVGGFPLPGVTMTLSGLASATATTDALGSYSFAGLANGTYSVTPSLAGYTFTPATAPAVVADANVTVPTFTAVFTAEIITVKSAMGMTRGKMAERLGALWNVRGTGTPNTTINIFLGATLTGRLLGSATVNSRGAWTFRKRVVVPLPVTATSISLASSAGGVLLDQPLKVR